jgi:hypothetical protein
MDRTGQRTISLCSTVDEIDIREFGPHNADPSWSKLGQAARWTESHAPDMVRPALMKRPE